MAYLPLSTANLPDPVIDPAQGSSPEDYFNTLAYDGTGVNPTTHTGVGFQPDFVWMHPRSRADNHNLFNVLSGAGQRLNSNNTSAETFTTHFISFDSDGFTTTADSGYNKSGDTYVAWNWKANGSGVTNTVGSIPSTVSANTTSGFSICTFTDAGSAGTVGHGLGVKPDLIIQKPRSGTNDWYVFTEVIDGSFDFLNLNTTGAKNNSTLSAPTSTVFSNLQISGDTVAYCFHSVEGFSKFGSYVGNGSTDGPFVYTGFRPSFVMVKRTDASNNWVMLDSERDVYNVANSSLLADRELAETDYGIDFDILSNGFKLRSGNTPENASGGTYIFMAFSDANGPFKYSNAR